MRIRGSIGGAVAILALLSTTSATAQSANGYNPGYYRPVAPQPQSGPPCGHIYTAPCPVAQSGRITIPANASGDTLYQMSLQAQKRGDIAAKMQYLKAAAERGQVNAQTGLALDLIYGKNVAADVPGGLKMMQAAAAQGHAAAQWQLGVIYDNGQYVAHDDALAVHYIQAAADQHYADAEDWIGTNYELGRNGVAHNRALAVSWLDRSASDSQNGTTQLMGTFLSGAGDRQFASYDELVNAYRAWFNGKYGQWSAENSIGAVKGGATPSCSGLYASATYCLHSPYSHEADVYRSSHPNE